MDFSLTEDQQAFVASARAFAGSGSRMTFCSTHSHESGPRISRAIAV